MRYTNINSKVTKQDDFEELRKLLQDVIPKRTFYSRFGFLSFVTVALSILYLISSTVLLPSIFGAIVIVSSLARASNLNRFIKETRKVIEQSIPYIFCSNKKEEPEDY